MKKNGLVRQPTLPCRFTTNFIRLIRRLSTRTIVYGLSYTLYAVFDNTVGLLFFYYHGGFFLVALGYTHQVGAADKRLTGFNCFITAKAVFCFHLSAKHIINKHI